LAGSTKGSMTAVQRAAVESARVVLRASTSSS
jgi:hypothetical protein